MLERMMTASAILVALLTGGCHCTADYRFSDFSTDLGSNDTPELGDSLRATFGLDQWRGSSQHQSWSWFIDVRPIGDSVVEARIVDPSELDPKRRVLGVLTGGYHPYRGIYRSYGADPYRGLAPYEEFWDLTLSEALELEVILADSPPLRGRLVLDNSVDWHSSCID